MKDLVIYEKQSKIIIAIITDYKESNEKTLVLNQLVDSAIVDSNKSYILTDNETGLVRFVNPDSKILYMEDYR